MNIVSAAFRVAVASLCIGMATHSAMAGDPDGADPVIQESKTSKALESLPPKPFDQRLPVTIYEFHSGVPAVSVGAATDIFTTALIRSGQFRVVERQRLSQDIVREKQLNAAGQADGDTAQKQLHGARYIFEGTVSEANASEDQRQGGVNVGGLSLGGGHNHDAIGVEVRIVDADTGDVLDSISVTKALSDTSVNVGGTAAFVSTLASLRGRVANPLTPDVNYQSSHQESVDKALRACIESSILALIKRVDLASSTPAGK
jgi:curli biogenesis system outer membrane secretion channel CsgG